MAHILSSPSLFHPPWVLPPNPFSPPFIFPYLPFSLTNSFKTDEKDKEMRTVRFRVPRSSKSSTNRTLSLLMLHRLSIICYRGSPECQLGRYHNNAIALTPCRTGTVTLAVYRLIRLMIQDTTVRQVDSNELRYSVGVHIMIANADLAIAKLHLPLTAFWNALLTVGL